MNGVIVSIFILALLALPPALLAIEFITGKPRWWLVALLTILFTLLGWGLVIPADVGEQARIGELIDQKRYDELPEGWGSDGASGVFAVLGGWLVPLAYFVPGLTLYALAALIRRLFTPRQAPGKRMLADAAKPRR